MYSRIVPENTYTTFFRNLEAAAHREPLDTSYYCDIQVNGIRYRLRLYRQGRRLYPTQAVRLDKNVRNCQLVTDHAILGALTEMIVAQFGPADK